MRSNEGKRVWSVFLTVVLVGGILTGCSSSSSNDTTEAASASATAAAETTTTDNETEAVADHEDTTIVIGSKDFTENLILAELYALALEDAGYTVERSFGIANSVVHTALVNDEIDLYPEYTGTALMSVLQLPQETDPQTVYDTVKAAYKEQFDIDWLDYSSATDSQGLVITTKASEEYGITTISDLQEHASELRFASQGEFDEREDGIPALEATYGPFDWKSSEVYDNALKYTVLLNDEADVAPAATTEGQLVNEEFTLLEDDKQVWPPYNIAPVVRGEILEANPEIAEILNAVSAQITTENLTELNARVDVDQEEYEEVAADFYAEIQEQPGA